MRGGADKYHATLWVIKVILWDREEKKIQKLQTGGEKKNCPCNHRNINLTTFIDNSVFRLSVDVRRWMNVSTDRPMVLDSPYVVGWDSGCLAGLQSSCKWCSFRSRSERHWVHRNLPELNTEENLWAINSSRMNGETFNLSKWLNVNSYILHQLLCYIGIWLKE